MKVHHSILRSNSFEPRLKWMILLSLIVHLIFFSIFIGKPPRKSKKVYFTPTYSVNLVSIPASSDSRSGSGNRKTSLWKGPARTASRVKTISARKHTVITIPKRKKRGRIKKNNAGGAHGNSIKKSRVNESELGSGETQGPGSAAAASGAAGTPNLRFSRYYTAVYQKIFNSWVLPGYGSKKNLEAVVNIRISKSGKILKTAFEQRSSNAYFDRSVLRAIKKADPLPPLPPAYNKAYLELGIRFIPEE